MTTRTVRNFSSGPAALPEPVLRRAQQALWDLDGSGIGILEHSHRGREFGRVLDRSEAVIREVGGIDDRFAVLFVTAGATHQFAMVPRNFTQPGDVIDVCNTGAWSTKAIEDAQRFATVHVACSGGPEFSAIAGPPTWSERAVYAHYTSNETIHGVQWQTPPRSPSPLVCDASSDLFSRPLVLEGHAMVYAGAQKNLGPPGITIVIGRRDFIDRGRRDLPTIEQYRAYVADKSMPNTPNTFGVYLVGEVVAWIRDQGGLPAMAERNARKAALLYDFLDHSRQWRGHAQRDSRSLMNVTFRGATTAVEQDLITRADARGLRNLAGHRSVGGLRASIYNAFPEQGVHELIALLHEVERDHT